MSKHLGLFVLKFDGILILIYWIIFFNESNNFTYSTKKFQGDTNEKIFANSNSGDTERRR